MTQLVETGPLSVLMDASLLQFYRRGVYPGRFCQKGVTDHAVLLVGYGTEKTIFGEKKYWIVQNSWGERWGEHGYFRVRWRRAPDPSMSRRRLACLTVAAPRACPLAPQLERGVHDSRHPYGVCNILIGVTAAEVTAP